MRINTPTNRSFKGKSFNINNGLIPYKFDLITLDLLFLNIILYIFIPIKLVIFWILSIWYLE